MKDLKYLFAYFTPLSAFLGLYLGGIWSLGSVYIGFLIIPLLEFVFPQSTANLSETEEMTKNQSIFFDILLYLNVPILYGVLWYFFNYIDFTLLTSFEKVATLLNVGLLLGSLGINVAHELGHRKEWYNKAASLALLLPNLYLHFNIEHNRGHHKNVATDKDPASSRSGEIFYSFWFRSVIGSYRSAWNLESKRLSKSGLSFWSFDNEMIRFHLIQFIYLGSIAFFFGPLMCAVAIIVAIIGFSTLELVNYIEHYGLRRKKLASGRYESVSPKHSWNSNHELGRIFLYELTRHSDHHFKASRKYQVLRHMDESPQLPYGYPASMIIALVPPMWFKLMDREVEKWTLAQAK